MQEDSKSLKSKDFTLLKTPVLMTSQDPAPGGGCTAACYPSGLWHGCVLIFFSHKIPQAYACVVNVFISYLFLGLLPTPLSPCHNTQELLVSTCYMVDVPKDRHWLEFGEWDGGRNRSFLPSVFCQRQCSFGQVSLPCGSFCYQAASRFNSKT